MLKHLSSIKGKSILFFLMVLSFNILTNAYAATESKQQPFSERAEVKSFIQYMNKRHQYDCKYLQKLFANVVPEPKILSLIAKPYEKLPWYKYQELLVSEQRVQSGIQFWKEHESMLKKAEAEYGVPAEIIVAIIGVETSYGKKKGDFPVLQTLATLAFDYPKRADFFKKELEEFLLLIKEQGLDPLKMTGSYAGAIGMPQFMPSSYRKYAVDSGNGQSDLINNDFDAILSVANYFKVHGWQKDEPIASVATLTKNLNPKKNTFLNQTDPKNPKPNISLKTLETQGIYSKAKTFKNKNALASFMVLERSPTAKEYWLGLNNFYVITRYNHSTHYALAVFQLGTRLKSLKQ